MFMIHLLGNNHILNLENYYYISMVAIPMDLVHNDECPELELHFKHYFINAKCIILFV